MNSALRTASPLADEEERGVVFDIQRCALHDGPGIRTTVFLKGCPLRCLWCHNPESQAFEPEMAVACRGDGSASGDIEMIGRMMTASDVLAEVSRDAAYYERSGGGMTLSGGEPMARFPFALSLLAGARRRGIHTCLDTSGQARTAYFDAVLPYVDLFLYDFKETDPDRHRELTGASNDLILRNLDFLYEQGARIVLRCPLVPGVNDSAHHLEGIAALDRRYPDFAGIEILPYHSMGKHKAERIGRDVPLPHLGNTDESTVEGWMATLRGLGCTRAVVG